MERSLSKLLVFSICLMVAFLAVPQVATTAEMIGVATEVSGTVELQRGDDVFALSPGVEVQPGDVIRSGDNSAAQVDMDDGSMLSMGENSEMTIREYQLGSDRSVLSASVELAVGWLRFAVAKLRSAGRYQIGMPTAVLGVRGTEGLLRVEPEDGHFSSHVLMEEGKVELAEREHQGRLLGARIQLAAGEYAERHFRGRLIKRHKAPAWLLAAVSKRMKKRLVRRAHLLKKRGIMPRKLKHSIRKQLIRRAIEKRKMRLRRNRYLQNRERFLEHLQQRQHRHRRLKQSR